ncbi:folate/biopterin family MFS transporter [Candidatus Peregrinibacteria bacterium]|nr:folate/biopterin family MFS transporter [Candidatus Peregrinibacteria bacterium]
MKRDLTGILIPFVYFIAGAVSLAGVATTFYFKEDLGLTIPQTSILGSIALIPWSIKPLYGFFSDRTPVFGLRRKPYLIFAGLLGSAGYFSMATWVQNFWGAFGAVFISGMGFALADVIVDGIVAERSPTQRKAGQLQSICRAALLTGALIVAYLSGILVELIGARNVFFITGTLPLLTCIMALLIKETPGLLSTFSLRETWQSIRSALSPGLLWAALFLFVWRSTPSSGGAFSYFLIDELHFEPEFFGRLSVISHVMGIVGVLVFRKFLLSVPLRVLFFWIMIASVILSLPTLGLIYGWYNVLGVSPKLFAMADTLISAPLSEIGFLPLMVLIARICPKGVEATMFALLASLANIGLAISDLGGGLLSVAFDIHQASEGVAANYIHLDKVMWIAILSSLLPLPLLQFLPETRVRDEIDPPDVSPSGEGILLRTADRGKTEVS